MAAIVARLTPSASTNGGWHLNDEEGDGYAVDENSRLISWRAAKSIAETNAHARERIDHYFGRIVRSPTEY